MEKENISWETAIKKSFYYEEYSAYGIEDQGDAVILSGWSKSDDHAYSEGGLYLKKEWILKLLNTIRGIPKNELERGTADDGYGEWKRKFNIPLPEINEDTELNVSLTNTYYDRSLPKLEIHLFCFDYRKEEIFEHKCIKRYETDEITISHGYGVDGYIRDVEPILLELEKYVPESEKSQILEPLGKPKTEIEEITERYEKRIAEYKNLKKLPVVYWIEKQLDKTHYDVTLVVFLKGKINSQKTISLSTKEMAMINLYMFQWIREIKTIPYKRENPVLKIEIEENPEFKDFYSAKITIKSRNDFFEIPFSSENAEKVFRDFITFTDAEKIYTDYIKDLEGYVEDDFVVLEWNKHSPDFFRLKKEKILSLYNGFTKKLPVAIFRSSLPFFDFEGFSFDVRSNDRNSDVISFSVMRSSDDDDSIKGHLSMEVFREDFTTEINKIISVLEKLKDEKTYVTTLEESEKIKWFLNEHYAGEDSVFYLSWTFENANRKQMLELPKELIYKIQEYAFWWWRASDHKEKISFENCNAFFEINPLSDRKGFGKVTLNLKSKRKNVEAYFDLQDGTNLPKDFCDSQYESTIRKIQQKKASDKRIHFELWNCKFTELNDKCKLRFSVGKDYLETFKSMVQELYEHLKNPEKKVADLLSKDYTKKFETKDFWIGFMENTLCVNCQIKRDVDEDIPLHITFYPKSDDDYFSFEGTKEILLKQFDLLLNVL